MNFSVETGNRTPFLRLSDPEYHYTFGYYSNNSWVDDHRIVLSRLKLKDPKRWNTPVIGDNPYGNGEQEELVLVDIQAQTETVLVAADVYKSSYVVFGNFLYYIHRKNILYRMDLQTREIREICRHNGMGFPHMTSDGKFLNWACYDEGTDLGRCFRINLETSEVVQMFEKKFAPPFAIANHMMICPTDPDLVYFAHEGDTFYVSNRLWLARIGEEPYHIADQSLDEQGNLGDCFGHEAWAPNGKGLYFVKYICSPKPPRGICHVDIATNEVKMLYSKYPYWHVSTSPDGRYLGADTQSGDHSSVCLIDMQTGEERLLVDARTNWVHPCHPHPMFNTICTKLAFHELDENEQITVGIMDVK